MTATHTGVPNPRKLDRTVPRSGDDTRMEEAVSVVVARQEIVSVLRRAGLEDLASEAASLPDPVSSKEIAEFCKAHGLSVEWLTNRMGSSP